MKRTLGSLNEYVQCTHYNVLSECSIHRCCIGIAIDLVTDTKVCFNVPTPCSRIGKKVPRLPTWTFPGNCFPLKAFPKAITSH